MGIIPGPFADFFNVTFPRDSFDLACDRLLGVAAEAGGFVLAPGLCRLGGSERFPGIVKFGVVHRVGRVSVSGQALAELRARGLLDAFLCAAGEQPHRVTCLHATLDVRCDARPVLRRLYARGKRGAVSFGRKAIPGHQVSAVRRAALYGGGDTGTVYLGKRTRDVWAKVYDKRNELLERALADDVGTLSGLADPGPLTRYELALGRHVGVSLRDVAAPEAVFWHFAGDVLLPRPSSAPAWSPAGDGYTLPPAPLPDYARQLELLLEVSVDIRRAVALSDRLGPQGREWLCHKLRSLAPQAPEAGAPSLGVRAGLSPA